MPSLCYKGLCTLNFQVHFKPLGISNDLVLKNEAYKEISWGGLARQTVQGRH
jgi:hypothetical protein